MYYNECIENLQVKALNLTFNYILFLIENSSSDGFLSLRLCRSFFMLLGLLLRSCAKTEEEQSDSFYKVHAIIFKQC